MVGISDDKSALKENCSFNSRCHSYQLVDGAFEEELEERNPIGVFPDHFPNLLKSASLLVTSCARASSKFVAMCQNRGQNKCEMLQRIQKWNLVYILIITKSDIKPLF